MTEAERKLALSGAQIAAGAASAVTVMLAGSFLGKAGTLAGAAAGSTLSAVATAVYAHWMHRSRHVFGRVRKRRVHVSVPALAGGTVALAALIIGSVTAVEALTGRPVSSLIGGPSGKGTSIGSVFAPAPQPDAPAVTTGSPSAAATPAGPAGSSPSPGASPALPSPSPDPDAGPS